MAVPFMTAQVLPQIKVQDIVERILASRRITRMDQQLLFSLRTLSADEQALINKVFDRLQQGFIRVSD